MKVRRKKIVRLHPAEMIRMHWEGCARSGRRFLTEVSVE